MWYRKIVALLSRYILAPVSKSDRRKIRPFADPWSNRSFRWFVENRISFTLKKPLIRLIKQPFLTFSMSLIKVFSVASQKNIFTRSTSLRTSSQCSNYDKALWNIFDRDLHVQYHGTLLFKQWFIHDFVRIFMVYPAEVHSNDAGIALPSITLSWDDLNGTANGNM